MRIFIKKHKNLIFTIIFLLALCIVPNIVNAATSSKLNFCQYGGTRRTFKIIGLAINFIKILVPLILMITSIITLSKTVFSGKEEDFKGGLSLLAKKAIAGVIIFLLPSALDYAFDTLIGYDDSSFTACTKCMLSPDNCQIPEEDPETYTD